MGGTEGGLPPEDKNPQGITPEDIQEALANQFNMELVDLDSIPMPPVEVLAMIEHGNSNDCNALPIDYRDGVLTVAISDPRKVNILDDLRFIHNCQVEAVLASKEQIQKVAARWYGAL